MWSDFDARNGECPPVLMDVGGGMGHLLATILERHERWKGGGLAVDGLLMDFLKLYELYIYILYIG